MKDGMPLMVIADVSSCPNDACPSRQVCWRWCKPTADRQTYTGFTVPAGDDRCGSFVPILRAA
jgi:hypothetical protein